jgi:hypothetical protein
MRKLPWPLESYRALEAHDLDPAPPTPEQRIRVAAAILTCMRDANMLGKDFPANAETVRAVLVMDAAAWARDIGVVAAALVPPRYDAEDPFVRWNQSTGVTGTGRN